VDAHHNRADRQQQAEQRDPQGDHFAASAFAALLCAVRAQYAFA
jgi:hypothetical protein